MGPGSKDGYLGGAGSIHSFIPVSLVREWALTRGTYRSDQMFPPAAMAVSMVGDPKREAFSLPVCGFPRGTSNSWAIVNSLNKSQQKYNKFHQGLLAGAVRTALNFAHQAE